MKWKTGKFALTGGIVWGVAIFLCTILNVYFGYATAFLNGIASIYPGFTLTLGGSIVGGIYGFFDMFIGVYIVAWLYQRLGK